MSSVKPANLARFRCSRCQTVTDFFPPLVDGRAASEFELYQMMHDAHGWNFVLLADRIHLCRDCTPLYIAERDAQPTQTSIPEPEAATSEQGRLL